MTANAADFAGAGCGRRYEKELETHFAIVCCFIWMAASGLSGTATVRRPALSSRRMGARL